MKRVIALILTVALSLVIFAGCGSTSTSETTTAGSEETTASSSTEKYTFTVVNHDSATSLCEKWLETILGKIADESDGRIEFQFNPGGSLFGASETIDAVKDGAADICWATTGTYGGRFPLTEFINLPGNGITSAQFGGAVLNTMYEEVEEVQDEFSGWKILALHGTSLSPICTTNTKIETKEDLSGLRLRVAGTIPAIYVNLIGASATALPTSEVYDNLSKNALDGMCNDWHNIDCFKLYEAVNYCLDVSINMTASMVLMNPDSYNQLPDDLKAIFDKYFASNYASDMAGYWWDSCRYFVSDEMEEAGVEIYEPTEEVYDALFSDEIVEQTAQEYIAFLDEKGYDGQAMYDKFMEIVDRYADQYANVWDEEFNYTDWDKSADGYESIY